MGEVGGAVGFAAVGDGGEVGGVGFYEHFINGNVANQIAKVRVFVGDYAGY